MSEWIKNALTGVATGLLLLGSVLVLLLLNVLLAWAVVTVARWF